MLNAVVWTATFPVAELGWITSYNVSPCSPRFVVLPAIDGTRYRDVKAIAPASSLCEKLHHQHVSCSGMNAQ
jgi:hypothetical protein